MFTHRIRKGEKTMKKITSKLLLLMMVLVMTFGMTACGKVTVSDYINSDEVKEAFSTLEKSLEGTGMSIKISAEDDKLIYTYTYDEIEKTDDMTAQLEQSISAQDATFQNTANEVKEYVSNDSVTVVIEYIDCNGDEIFSKEYVSE